MSCSVDSLVRVTLFDPSDGNRVAGPRDRAHPGRGSQPQRKSIPRRRSALPMTDTELKLIAAAASMGLKRMPRNG